MLPNLCKLLLLGLMSLVSSRPCASAEDAHLLNRMRQPLTLRFGEPQQGGAKVRFPEGVARLTVETLELQPGPGQEGRSQAHAFDLGGDDLPATLLLGARYSVSFSCRLPAGSSVTVPIKVSGHDQRTGGTYTFGLQLECVSGKPHAELTLGVDPAYLDVPLPFQVVRLEADSREAEADPILGLLLLPLDRNGPTHRTLRSVRNLSSLSDAAPEASCCGMGECVIL